MSTPADAVPEETAPTETAPTETAPDQPDVTGSAASAVPPTSAAPAAPPTRILPAQSREDTDVGWGDYGASDDNDRLLRDRPPHWGNG